MATPIPQVARARREVLTTTAEVAAQATKYVHRPSPLGGATCSQPLVCGVLGTPQASLEERAQTAATLGAPSRPRRSLSAFPQRLPPVWSRGSGPRSPGASRPNPWPSRCWSASRPSLSRRAPPSCGQRRWRRCDKGGVALPQPARQPRSHSKCGWSGARARWRGHRSKTAGPPTAPRSCPSRSQAGPCGWRTWGTRASTRCRHWTTRGCCGGRGCRARPQSMTPQANSGHCQLNRRHPDCCNFT